MSKPRGRPFEPGNKFGRGRPRGSRNKKGSLAKELLAEYEPHLMRKTIGLAMQGNVSALKICLERLVPAPHDACVSIKLPKIKTVADVNSAAEMVTRGMAKGILSPSEGVKLMNILESQSRVIENGDVVKRLENLERVYGDHQEDSSQ